MKRKTDCDTNLVIYHDRCLLSHKVNAESVDEMIPVLWVSSIEVCVDSFDTKRPEHKHSYFKQLMIRMLKHTNNNAGWVYLKKALASGGSSHFLEPTIEELYPEYHSDLRQILCFVFLHFLSLNIRQ